MVRVDIMKKILQFTFENVIKNKELHKMFLNLVVCLFRDTRWAPDVVGNEPMCSPGKKKITNQKKKRIFLRKLIAIEFSGIVFLKNI